MWGQARQCPWRLGEWLATDGNCNSVSADYRLVTGRVATTSLLVLAAPLATEGADPLTDST
jgi:hypothetical protein